MRIQQPGGKCWMPGSQARPSTSVLRAGCCYCCGAPNRSPRPSSCARRSGDTAEAHDATLPAAPRRPAVNLIELSAVGRADRDQPVNGLLHRTGCGPEKTGVRYGRA